MNIYILTEQAFNGTVGMSVATTLVKAKTFKEAIEKIKAGNGFKRLTESKEWKLEYTEDEKHFKYSVYPINKDWLAFPTLGNMDNKPAKFIK